MPRGLSTEIKTAIAADTVRPVYLAYFDFASGDVRTWTGEGDLSYDGQTWSGDGRVIRWPTITESVQLVAHNITVDLSSLHTYSAAPTDPDEYRARTCEIYIGFLDSNGDLPAANVYKVFSGRMARLTYVEDAQEDAYSLVVESRMVDLSKAKPARYTHQTQLQRFAGDKGLEYASNAQASLFLSRGEVPNKPFSRKLVYGETKVTGSVVFIATSGTGSRYLNLVVAFADHECQSIEQLYLDDRAVLVSGSVGGEFLNVVDYYPHLGTDAQTVDTALQAEVGSLVWSNDHRLRGITYVYLRILYSEELFGDAAPRVAARIKGKKLYDPRSATTAYSDNAALAVRDYLLSEDYGFSSGAAEIDETSVAVAANDCDLLVDRADGTQEKRYTASGWLDTAERIGDNLDTLLAAMAGKVSYMGGVFALYAGTYALTSLTVADRELVDESRLDNRNLREAYNGARGIYRTPALDWQEEDYPAYQNSTALATDGEPRWLDLPLPLTTSAARAQRIAKIAVMRSRAAREVELSAMLSALNIRSGDVISVTTAKSQIGSLVYEVRALTIALELQPRVDLELLEVAPADYTWNAAAEESQLTSPAEPADSILAWTQARLSAPSASPGSQTFTVGFDVTVTHNESDVTVRYTTDGSEPDETDSSVADEGTIAIGTSTTTLKLKSFQNVGSLTSEVVTYEYTYEAPTDLVPEPDHQWSWNLGAFSPDTSSGPRLRYVISGLGDCKLYRSSNGGSSWTLLQDGTVDGTYYTDTQYVPSSWTPSNWRAYGTKPAYLDSNQLVVPDQAIPPSLWREIDEFGNYRIGIQIFGTNAKVYWRYATKSKFNPGNGWSTWSSYSSRTGLGWGDVIGTRFPNLTFESSSSWYEYEVYVEQSGFSDSVVIYANADTRAWRYGGEGGVWMGFIPSKSDGYSD